MSKKKIAIIKLSVISVVVALLIIFSFISFDGYTGFFNSAEKGLDLSEGIYANYSVTKNDGVTDEEFVEDFNNTFLKIKSLLVQKGFQGTNIYKASNNTIRIETPNTDDSKEILEEIGLGEFKIRGSDNSSDEVKISGKDVLFAVATTSTTTGYWGTYIQFSEETADILADMTKSATESSPAYVYFYRGNSENYFFYVPVSSPISAEYLFVSSSSGAMTQGDAISLAISISCGSMPAKVEAKGSIKAIYPLDGAVLGLSIALGVSLLAILAIFAVLYRELGIMACISILFYVGAMLFFIQAIPIIMVSSVSLGAIIAGLILVSACNFIILEKGKYEYAIGKKLNIAIKTGYKRSVNLIADVCAILALTSLIAFFISTDLVKSFAIMMLVGSIIACFSSLFLTYHLVNSYSELNKNNPKKTNFVREEDVNEIE